MWVGGRRERNDYRTREMGYRIVKSSWTYRSVGVRHLRKD